MAYNDGYKGHKDSIKTWVIFTMSSSTTIKNSYNVSSVTDAATGNCQVNYATALASANYACFADGNPKSGSSKNYSHGAVANSTTYGTFYREDSNGTAHDSGGDVHFFAIGR